MKEDNTSPVSPQGKREPGYYWVKDKRGNWLIAELDDLTEDEPCWMQTGSKLTLFGDLYWTEIDERRITRSTQPDELSKAQGRIKELEAMIEQFTYYGLIHTVKGVVPVDYDSHEDLIKKAKQVFQKP